MKFEKDFKEAISNLPSKEKDKLLFRLLKKDLALVNRLHFELLESKPVDQKRNDLELHLQNRIGTMTKNFHSPGVLMMGLRYLSGDINEHVYTTKDKFGEISLNILMLKEVLKLNNTNVENFTYGKAYKFCIYVIARAFKILLMIDVLHEDYKLDFNEDLNALGELIGENHYLMTTAINNGLDVNWLLRSEIPENIKEIHKEIRAQGFLK